MLAPPGYFFVCKKTPNLVDDQSFSDIYCQNLSLELLQIFDEYLINVLTNKIIQQEAKF